MELQRDIEGLDARRDSHQSAERSRREEIAALTFASNALIERRDRIVADETDLEDKIAAAIAHCHAAIDALQTLDLNDSPGKAAKCLGKAWHRERNAAASARPR